MVILGLSQRPAERGDDCATCFRYEVADGSDEHGARRGPARSGGRRRRPRRICARTAGRSRRLSLGYFQRLAEARADPRFQSVPLVQALDRRRRDLAPPRSDLRARRPGQPSPGAAQHPAVSGRALSHRGRPANRGISAERRGNVGRSANVYEKRRLLCFTDPDPEDIVTKGVKIVGSAQRRRGGAVLQHGSLLLARSSRTPELPGICDVADESASNHDWSNEVLDRIPHALGTATRGRRGSWPRWKRGPSNCGVTVTRTRRGPACGRIAGERGRYSQSSKVRSRVGAFKALRGRIFGIRSGTVLRAGVGILDLRKIKLQ